MPSGVVIRGIVALALALAPFQCVTEPDPAHVREESPAEALYQLADRFKAEGDERARIRTLRWLVERYPKSRFASMAEEDLEAMNLPAEPKSPPPPP